VPDTRLDREFQEQTDAAELRGKYPDNIRENLVRYQKSIRACIKIPLIVGQEVRGVMCLHREQESHFYLGMVHVVELLAKNAAGELACVLVSDEYSARAEGFRARISTRDSLMKLVDGFDLGTARHKLFNSLANEAKELSGALRAAVAVINEPWTKVSVLAATSGWPIDRFELAIPLRKVDGEKSGVLTAIMEGHSYTVQDVNSLEAQYFSPDGDREKVVSSANIRMECGPNLLGVLVLDWTTPQSFDPVVRGMLESLAKSYAEAIHAYEVHHLTLLLDKLLRAQSEEIDRVPEHAWKFQPLLAHAARMFGVAEGSLFIRNRDTGLFDLKASLMQPELVERVDQSYALGEGLTGWIAQNNRAIHIRDLRNSADLHRAAPGAVWKNKIKDNDHADVQDRSTSFLGAPLSMGSEVLGVLRFNIDTKRRPFDIFDESLAESIAARMGDWLYDRDEVIRRLAQLKLLEQILTCKDIDQLVELIYIAIEAGVGRIGCHVRMRDRIQEGRDREPEEVFLLKGKPRRPYWIDPRNQGTPWQGPSRFHRSHEDATGHVWEKRETLYDPDVKAVDSKCRQVQTPSWFLENVGSVVVTPLMGNEKIVGTLHVYKPNPMSFSPAEVDFIEDVARIASNGLMSLQARERVNSDMSLRQVTDAAIQQHLSAPESPRLRMQLMQDLLHVLTNHLRARQGWFLWPDESRQAFKVMESSGAPVAVVPPIPISHLDAILRDKGFQLAFGLGMDDEIQKWVGSWKCTDNNRSEYLKRAQERQYLLIAMQDTHHTSTVFCIEAAPDHVISFDEAQHLKKILNQIHQSFNLAVEYLKNLEREQRRFEEAAKPLGLIGATASSMEHNFRRPVDNMIKTLEYLMTNPREPNQIQKKLTYMMGQVDSLNSSVHQLISVSAGKQHSAAVPLVPILEAAIEKARLIIPHIFLKPGAENVLVHAAARLLGNALELLLMNAAEAVASRGADALVSVGVTATDSVCEIRIVDNGPGMDVANSMRPFVSTKGKERGLGLPTALFLIRIQDGRLDIQPEEGRGTTVIVTLPIGKGV
jgi:signal transduction histidine kinase/transcriptional regulator with GAF, ATPase, and Fis domain